VRLDLQVPEDPAKKTQDILNDHLGEVVSFSEQIQAVLSQRFAGTRRASIEFWKTEIQVPAGVYLLEDPSVTQDRDTPG